MQHNLGLQGIALQPECLCVGMPTRAGHAGWIVRCSTLARPFAVHNRFPRIVGRWRFSAAMAAAAPTVNLSASPVLVDFSWRAWRLNSVGRRGAVVSSSADCMLSEEHGRGKTSTSFAKRSSINRGLDSAVLVAFLLHPASQVSQASPGSFFSLFHHQPCQ